MKKIELSVFEKFDKQWALLTAGDEKDFNTMTISWGELGTLWGKPVATVYVRPSRYTYKYMENSEYFTVSFYSGQYKKALSLLGKLSGRDCDKVSEAGLTPELIEQGITFAEAELTLICKKIYFADMDPALIPEDVKMKNYPDGDYHRMYIGEVVEIV